MIDERLLNGNEKVSVIQTFDRTLKVIRRRASGEPRMVPHFRLVGHEEQELVIEEQKLAPFGFEVESREFTNFADLRKYVADNDLEISRAYMHGDYRGGKPPERVVYVYEKYQRKF